MESSFIGANTHRVLRFHTSSGTRREFRQGKPVALYGEPKAKQVVELAAPLLKLDDSTENITGWKSLMPTPSATPIRREIIQICAMI